MLWRSELSKTLIHLTVDGWGWVPSLLLWRSKLSKTLIHLTVDGWGWVPSLLVVLPEAIQHWSLPVLFGGVNGRLWEGSRQGELPRTSAASVLIPTVKQPPLASAGDPPTPAGRSGSVSPRVTAPSPGSRCTRYFVCALQEWSLCFPQSCQSPAINSHQASKSDSLGIPPPVAGPPGWEA